MAAVKFSMNSTMLCCLLVRPFIVCKDLLFLWGVLWVLCGGVYIVNGVFAFFDSSSGEKVFCDFLSSGKFFCKYDFQHAVHSVQEK